MNKDNGNILMKLIYLCMDHLMHNPKRAIIILFAVFIVTMITGELIGTVRNSEIVFSPTAIPIVSDTVTNCNCDCFLYFRLENYSGKYGCYRFSRKIFRGNQCQVPA